MGSLTEMFSSLSGGALAADQVEVLPSGDNMQMLRVQGRILGKYASEHHGEHVFHYHSHEHSPSDIDKALAYVVECVKRDHNLG